MRQILRNLGWTCILLVSVLLLPQVQAAPLYNATTSGYNATGNNSTGRPTQPAISTTPTANAERMVTIDEDIMKMMEEQTETTGGSDYEFQHIRERRSADNEACISENTTLADAIIMAAAGKPSCSGYIAPQWLFLTALSQHQERLFVASAVCFFAVIFCYTLLHFFGGVFGKVLNYLSIVFTGIAYTCTLTMAALHLTTVSSPERISILVCTLVVLFILSLKLVLHITLSIRAKSGRPMSFNCNFAVVPQGGVKGRVAFTGYQMETPTILLMLCKTVKPSEDKTTTGKHIWKLQGQTRDVESLVPQPGALTVYSFFGKKTLPLRSIQPSTAGFNICIYSVMTMEAPVKVKSSVARSFTKMKHSSPEQTQSLMQAWSDEESEE